MRENGQEQARNRDGTFVRGHSGNPAGRPKGSISLVERVRRDLLKHPEKADEIVDNWISRAMENPRDLEHLVDRIDGKLGVGDQSGVTVTIVFRDSD